MYPSLKAIMFMAILSALTGTALGDPSAYGDQETALLDSLSAINRYSPLEGAYSHGSIGATFGVGVQNYERIEANALQKHHLYMSETDDRQTVTAPRMYLVKGLAIPVDVGVSLGATQDEQISMAGAHIQWSVFEGFRLPAVALRASYNRLFGLHDAEMQSTRYDLVASTNVVSFLSVYGYTGVQRNQVTLNSSSYFQYGLVAQPEDLDYQKTWMNKAHAIGIRALLIPPLLAVTGELQFDSATGRSLAAKVSLDI